MKWKSLLLMVIIVGCYQQLAIEGIEKKAWMQSDCDGYRTSKIDLLINNKEILLNATQNEIESLLGAADEHELYKRNQKYFHYRISSPKTCEGQKASISKYLSIRFNALGNANEVLINYREELL